MGIKELTEQLEGLSKVQRERVVKEVLEKKGVNLKAARLVLKDLDDVNEESVNNWLDDNAGVAILHDWFKDALMQKNGIVKAYWENKEDITKERYFDLSDDELNLSIYLTLPE